jgi:hypothetical protein
MSLLTRRGEKSMKKIVAVMTALFLLVAVASFAHGAKAKVMEAKGKVVSVNDNSIVIDHKVQGKDTQTTFVMNAQTKKEGKLAPNGKATVHYKVESGQNVATVVKEGAAK